MTQAERERAFEDLCAQYGIELLTDAEDFAGDVIVLSADEEVTQ